MKVGVLVRRNSRNVDGVVQAANIANRLQLDFEFDVEQVDWLQKGNGELRPKDVVQKVKEKHPGGHLIVVISPPLKGDYLDYARRGMNIVSTAGWNSRFAPPPLAIYILISVRRRGGVICCGPISAPGSYADASQWVSSMHLQLHGRTAKVSVCSNRRLYLRGLSSTTARMGGVRRAIRLHRTPTLLRAGFHH